jgi:hydroxyacylglutathione hydrolase
MREEAIYGRVKTGDRSVEEIVKNIYADIDPRLRGAAGLSTMAHLEHLIERKKIRRFDDRFELVIQHAVRLG